jgi:CRP/FNR family transcriptional regulator, cyclic AMP receptor protein
VTTEAALAAAPLFASLDRRHRERLAKMMTSRKFDAGTTILRQGTSPVALYLVLEGQVRVERAPEDGVGSPTELATLGEGEVFGEMGLLDDEARSTSVIALVPTTCALLSRWEFQQELHSTPEVAITLLRALSRRIRLLDERLAQYEERRAVE